MTITVADVRRMLAGKQPEEETAVPPTVQTAVSSPSLVDVPGVDDKLAKLLKKRGYTTVEKLASASINDLITIRGISRQTALKLQVAAKGLIGSD